MTKTHRIDNGRHSILVSDHADAIFICSSVDGAGIGGFYTRQQCMELAAELIGAARRVKKRQAVKP